MIVYVELALFNNFLISYVLLFLTKKICLINTKLYRILLSCVFSSLISLLLPLLHFSSIFMLFIKVLIGLLCVVIAFSAKTIKKLLKFFLVYLALTFGFGGVVYAFISIIKLDLNSVTFLNTPFVIAFVGIYVLLVMFILSVVKLIKVLNKHSKVTKFLYKAKLTINNKTYLTNAFLDSGNRLKDSISGEGISIVTFTFLSKFLTSETMLKLAQKNLDNLSLKDAHLVEFSSVGASKQQMLVFSANLLELELEGQAKTFCSPKLGVVFKQFSDNVDYDILLAGDCLTK